MQPITVTPTTTPIVNAAECRNRLSQDPTLRIVDVRTSGEFQSVHIPGSYNIPLDTLGEHATELARLGLPVLLVCQSGARASQANETLCASGTDQLLMLEGGINAWEAAGGEVTRGATTTWALDRQVRLAAGLLVLTGVIASTVFAPALWLAGAVAAGLCYSAISNTCAMGNVLAKLPYNQSSTADVAKVIASLRTEGNAT